MAVVAGQRRTDLIASSQRVVDLHKPILLLEPDSAPITTFTNSVYNGGQREAARDPVFKWHNDKLEVRFDAINEAAGYAAGATALVVDDGTLFAIEDIVKVPRTGEVLFVTGISTNTLTVTRGFGATSGAALVDNDPLYIIGSAAEEGDTSLAARSENPTLVTNYTQIFKTSVEESGTALSSSNESTPHDWVHQSRKKMIEHRKDIEGAFLFGSPGEETGPGGAKTRVTGGLLHFLTSNNQDAGGALTEAEFNTWISNATRYGTKVKTVFASRLVMSVLSAFSAGKLHTTVGDTVYGVQIMKWLSPHGSVNLVTHNMLEGAIWGGYAIAVDFKAQGVKYRYLNGAGPGPSRDTHVEPNIEENDRDGRKDQILSECGLQVGLPETGAVLTGVTS